MARLLVVHHSPPGSLTAMLEAVLEGTIAEGIEGVETVALPALEATLDDVLTADGYLLGTPANLGYISGALKHFFDTVYNGALERTSGRPFGAYVHGESDTTGAVLAIAKITTGLGWRALRPPLSLIGPLDAAGLEACRELGAVSAATLMD